MLSLNLGKIRTPHERFEQAYAPEQLGTDDDQSLEATRNRAIGRCGRTRHGEKNPGERGGDQAGKGRHAPRPAVMVVW